MPRMWFGDDPVVHYSFHGSVENIISVDWPLKINTHSHTNACRISVKVLFLQRLTLMASFWKESYLMPFKDLNEPGTDSLTDSGIVIMKFKNLLWKLDINKVQGHFVVVVCVSDSQGQPLASRVHRPLTSDNSSCIENLLATRAGSHC